MRFQKTQTMISNSFFSFSYITHRVIIGYLKFLYEINNMKLEMVVRKYSLNPTNTYIPAISGRLRGELSSSFEAVGLDRFSDNDCVFPIFTGMDWYTLYLKRNCKEAKITYHDLNEPESEIKTVNIIEKTVRTVVEAPKEVAVATVPQV